MMTAQTLHERDFSLNSETRFNMASLYEYGRQHSLLHVGVLDHS